MNKSLTPKLLPRLFRAALLGALLPAALLPARAQGPNPLITGKSITLPNAAFRQAVGSLPMNMILAPGGRYALVTDMGFRQSLWSVDTVTGRGVSHLDFPNGGSIDPAKTNGLYYGLAAAPNGDGTSTLYAAQGDNGTVAKVTVGANGALAMAGTITLPAGQFAAGVALDGRGDLYVAVNENYAPGAAFDNTAFLKPSSLAIYSAATGLPLGAYTFNELSFPNAAYPGIPALGVPPVAAGMATPPSFPLAVAALRDGSKVFVSSQRDGKVYVLNAAVPGTPTLLGTIPTGAHPVALLLNRAQTRLYVANASSDTVSVVDTVSDAILDTVLLRPTGTSTLAGATPTNLALSPDENTLYATLGDMNAVAVVSVASLPSSVTGYIPTGWYPTAVAVNPANSRLLVADAKGTQTRNPNKAAQGPGGANGTYILNIIEGNVLTFPVPGAKLLAADTRQVLGNNAIPALASATNPLAGIGLGAGKIKHVVYIVKENRTYDQVLGDLPQGNGDPSLALFGDRPGAHVTPNFHALASRFVLLDNFYDCGEASGDGWPWSTGSFANEYVIKNLPYNYSGRGRNYDFEGSNNFFITGGFPATDPDGRVLSPLFPTGAPAIPDAGQAPAGHIWDDVVANVKLAGTGLTVPYRNYGFFYSLAFPTGGGLKPPTLPVPDNYPAVTGVQPPGHDLAGVSDYDFREFDLTYPDSDAPAMDGVAANYKTLNYSNYLPTSGKASAPSRFEEFKKEFGEMLPPGTTDDSRVPAFLTVRFMSDHTDGTTPGDPSPRAHVADNDYGVGQFVDLISHSAIWGSTAIFVIEDDAQDGQDHVDAHRSTCYVVSPYIHANSVDHTFYNTDSVLKTMEQLLGVPPLSQYDAVANTITDFDAAPGNAGPYDAILPDAAIVGELNPKMTALKPGTEAYRLARLAARMDFKHPDSADPVLLNEMIWKSVKGMDSPVPAPRHALGSPAAKMRRRDGDD